MLHTGANDACVPVEEDSSCRPTNSVYFSASLAKEREFLLPVYKGRGQRGIGFAVLRAARGKDDRALKEALDLLRGAIADAAFPPNPIR